MNQANSQILRKGRPGMDDSYILFKTYLQLHMAEMELNILQSEGIDAYVTDKNMGS